jgi:hypothetical protein
VREIWELEWNNNGGEEREGEIRPTRGGRVFVFLSLFFTTNINTKHINTFPLFKEKCSPLLY